MGIAGCVFRQIISDIHKSFSIHYSYTEMQWDIFIGHVLHFKAEESSPAAVEGPAELYHFNKPACNLQVLLNAE